MMIAWRRAGQTWFDVVVERGQRYGLAEEAARSYFLYLDAGLTSDEAAFEALYDHDLLSLDSEQEGPRGLVIDAH